MWAYTDDENRWLEIKRFQPEAKGRNVNDNHPDRTPQTRAKPGPLADPSAPSASDATHIHLQG